MPTTHAKVLGGGNTYVKIGLNGNTRNVEFLAQITDTPGGPLAPPEQIQPIGSPYPVEIATAYGQNAGQIQLSVWATWGRDGWVSAFLSAAEGERSGSIPEVWSNYNSKVSSADKHNKQEGVPVDLYEVLKAQRLNNVPITVYKVERGANGAPVRFKSYQNCVITNIDAQERVTAQAMSQQVVITMMYTSVIVTGATQFASEASLL